MAIVSIAIVSTAIVHRAIVGIAIVRRAGSEALSQHRGALGRPRSDLGERSREAEVGHLHEAVGVEQQVARLHVAVEQLRAVHVLERLERLPRDVLLVDVLQDRGADGGVQVGLHDLEDEVDVAVVVRLQAVDQRHDVLVTSHLLRRRTAEVQRCRGAEAHGRRAWQRRRAEVPSRRRCTRAEQGGSAGARRGPSERLDVARGSPHLEEHDLAERALRVGRVLERVEYLLERHHLLRLLIHRPPYDAIRALAKLLDHLVLPQHVPVDLVRPAVVVSWAWGSRPAMAQGREVGAAAVAH
eukprot:scaffold61765_cov60-Phaeocystis_antarctica.AAC.2